MTERVTFYICTYVAPGGELKLHDMISLVDYGALGSHGIICFKQIILLKQKLVMKNKLITHQQLLSEVPSNPWEYNEQK
jgi:hypothetical protein